MLRKQRVCIPQDQETPLQTMETNLFCRFTYLRAKESQQACESGQDYLTFMHSPTRFCFALCDGVSLSFHGELAAKMLGDALVEWVTQQKPPLLTDGKQAQVRLHQHLQSLTVEATKQIQSHIIPPPVSPWVRDVLEEKRTLGSEAAFVCGCLDDPSEKGNLFLAWMGDIRIRLWDRGIEHSHLLGDSFHTIERWSTRRGAIYGIPHTASLPLQSLTHLQVYSDGIQELDTWQQIPTTDQLQSLIDTAQHHPTSDDISLIELSW